MAVRQGFEPWDGYKPSHTFQACALNRSAISPCSVCRSIRSDLNSIPSGIRSILSKTKSHPKGGYLRAIALVELVDGYKPPLRVLLAELKDWS